MAVSDALAIATRLRAAAAALPPQTHLPRQLRRCIESQLDAQLAESGATQLRWSSRDATALENIASNNLEHRFGPGPTSRIAAFLPPEQRFSLLGAPAQKQLAATTVLSFVVHRLRRGLGLD